MIIVWIVVFLVVAFFGSAIIVGIYEAIQNDKIEKERDKIAKIIMSSNIQSISKIAQISGINEKKVIRAITSAIETASDEEGLREFLTAYIDFDKMQILFDKETWNCVYCGFSNSKEVFTCKGCGAPRE